MDHVKTSLLKKSFSSLYFTVGLVQEVGELADELKKKNDLNCKDNLVSKVGELFSAILRTSPSAFSSMFSC